MHLVLLGPYEISILLIIDVDIWSFGCLQFSLASLDLQTTRSSYVTV